MAKTVGIAVIVIAGAMWLLAAGCSKSTTRPSTQPATSATFATTTMPASAPTDSDYKALVRRVFDRVVELQEQYPSLKGIKAPTEIDLDDPSKSTLEFEHNVTWTRRDPTRPENDADNHEYAVYGEGAISLRLYFYKGHYGGAAAAAAFPADFGELNLWAQGLSGPSPRDWAILKVILEEQEAFAQAHGLTVNRWVVTRREVAAAMAALATRPASQSAGAPATKPATSSATQPSTQPAKELTLDLGNKVTMKLVLIPAGKFMMGSPDDEKDRDESESPQHEVTISKPFYMGVYDVTQAQWQAVMGSTPWKDRDKECLNESPSCAATEVSWQDATDFCKKLSLKAGKATRLPTEAQWEYACRAGSTTRFYYGDDSDYSRLHDYAWYTTDPDDMPEGTHHAHEVGQKRPNDWGLYDMSGNVWQWCADWRGPYANAKNIDPQGPASGKDRVLRGGSWNFYPKDCRSARRFWIDPGEPSFNFGFRVVVEVPGDQAGVK